MEVSVISTSYTNLGVTNKAEEKILSLKRVCMAVNGLFTVLWHNSEMVEKGSKRIYQSTLFN